MFETWRSKKCSWGRYERKAQLWQDQHGLMPEQQALGGVRMEGFQSSRSSAMTVVITQDQSLEHVWVMVKGLDLIIRKPLGYFVQDVISAYKHLIYVFRSNSAYVFGEWTGKKRQWWQTVEALGPVQVGSWKNTKSSLVKILEHRVSTLTWSQLFEESLKSFLFWLRNLNEEDHWKLTFLWDHTDSINC